jgi:uncharacterized membrane protein
MAGLQAPHRRGMHVLRDRLSPRVRRVVQAVLYETLAVAFVTPVLAWGFDESVGSALGLSVTLSAIALCWNYAFNTWFERWERRQTTKGRSWRRRVVHGVGFEGGLTLFLVPTMAVWLDTSLWIAFLADLVFLAFFLVYTVAFTWAFDAVFGLPESAQPASM